jgi:hypothetical protein
MVTNKLQYFFLSFVSNLVTPIGDKLFQLKFTPFDTSIHVL